jgi:hypothetical protein
MLMRVRRIRTVSRSNFLSVLPIVVAIALPAIVSAQTIDIRRNSVIPVVFDDTLSIKDSRTGERFHSFVDNDPQLPKGTELNGQIIDIKPARGKEPASMQLAFTDLVLPDGRHIDIDAAVVPLDAKLYDKDANGRLIAKPDSNKKGGQVLGGALGGLVIGSLIGKQLEATIIGALAGILIAETDKSNDGNIVVKKGQKMGALLRGDLVLDPRNQDEMGQIADEDTRDVPPVRDNPPLPPRERIPADRRDDVRPPARQDKIIVTYGSRNLLWDRDKPYWDGDVAMVPLDHTAIQMGLRTSPDKDNQEAIFIEGRQGYLQIEVDARTARLNGRTVELEVPVRREGDMVFVPLDLLVAISKESVYLNGERIEARKD